MKNAFENLKSFLFFLNFEIKGIRLWGVVEHDFLHISYFLDFRAMSPRMKYPTFSPRISRFAPWGMWVAPDPFPMPQLLCNLGSGSMKNALGFDSRWVHPMKTPFLKISPDLFGKAPARPFKRKTHMADNPSRRPYAQRPTSGAYLIFCPSVLVNFQTALTPWGLLWRLTWHHNFYTTCPGAKWICPQIGPFMSSPAWKTRLKI